MRRRAKPAPRRRAAAQRARRRDPRPGSRPPAGSLSLRAYAKRQGVSHTAIGKAIANGRLAKSIGRHRGRPLVLDPALADQEWTAGASKPNPNGNGAGGTAAASLSAAQTEVSIERAVALRLSNAQKSGRLIDGETAQRDAFECARTVRDAVMSVVDRISAELAAEHDVARVHARLGDELRAALAAAHEILDRG